MNNLGIILTILYLIITAFIAYIIRQDLATLSIPEWTGVITSVTSIPTFFWLVIGHIQQGKNIEITAKSLEHQIEKHRLATEPRITVTNDKSDLHGEIYKPNIILKNQGGKAIDIKISIYPSNQPPKTYEYGNLKDDEERPVPQKFHHPPPKEIKFDLSYSSSTGEKYHRAFLMKLTPHENTSEGYQDYYELYEMTQKP